MAPGGLHEPTNAPARCLTPSDRHLEAYPPPLRGLLRDTFALGAHDGSELRPHGAVHVLELRPQVHCRAQHL